MQDLSLPLFLSDLSKCSKQFDVSKNSPNDLVLSERSSVTVNTHFSAVLLV